jgi:nucleoside-diphosphate-sugar epimerase
MVDNMMTQRYSSLFNLPSLANYKFIEGDVQKMDLDPLFNQVDVVVHLAAITDAVGSFDKAKEVEENNFISTENVANACVQSGSKLITLSSTSVYGTQNEIVDEDCLESELQPQSPYASTKLKEENLIASMCIKEKLRAVTFRFGTIFGVSPGKRFHTAVNKFCWQASLGLPITVWTTAYDQKRPYLDLQDASNAIAFTISNDIFDGKIYNVLTTNVTVREVVEIIEEFVPSLSIDYVDSKIMNQLSYEVSCNRFMSLGFNFQGDLKRGINQTISLFK